jgi:two-component system chemotaxis sensor kinase CheA
VELLLKGVAAIEQRLRAFEKDAPVPAAPGKLLDALRELQLVPGRAVSKPGAGVQLPDELLSKLSESERDQLTQGLMRGRRAVRLMFVPSPERSQAGISITTVRERVAELADIVKVLPQSMPKSAASPSGLAFILLVVTDRDDTALAAAAGVPLDALISIEPDAARPDGPPSDDDALSHEQAFSDASARGTIRVDIGRLDDALDKLTSLIVTRFRLARQVGLLREQGVDVRELAAILHEQARQIRELRSAITRARMVPMAQVLERVPLLVRGLSRTTGKKVVLQIDAGDAELDKSVAEQVFPAIVHLVRNAVDHAIEPPEVRKRQGKAEAGNIAVRCLALSDTHLEVTVTDDGAGIDRQRVARKARREEPRDDRELLELITRPGLSTQEVVTENSGRGMGMDIVKRITVEQLGGELALESTPGRGTTFTLRIPLSISILDSFAFRCGSQRFVVPLAMVEAIVELESSDVYGAPAPNQSRAHTKMLLRGGEPIPLFDLASLFQLERASATQAGLLGSALVVSAQGERFALSVDRMLGQQEVVVRPLEDPLVKVPGVAGTTDLGDGVPTLVLDLLGVGQLAARTPWKGMS